MLHTDNTIENDQDGNSYFAIKYQQFSRTLIGAFKEFSIRTNHFSMPIMCCVPTMPAKSPGTLPVIYAVDKQENPLPRKTMLYGGDTNCNGGENYVFPSG